MATISITDVIKAQEQFAREEITFQQYMEIENAYNQQQLAGASDSQSAKSTSTTQSLEEQVSPSDVLEDLPEMSEDPDEPSDPEEAIDEAFAGWDAYRS